MKYRKKPVVIEAVKWTGENVDEIAKFTEYTVDFEAEDETFEKTVAVIIPTLEGDMRGSIGDYIIKGVDGEFYPCKPDIFEKTYEVAEE